MGFFISFEGGEGAGKTSQINSLATGLMSNGHRVVTTREPGGTPEGEKIRNLIVQRDGGNWIPIAEILLLYAARVMHIERVIKPALAEGAIVISDRFFDSTLAYQGYGQGFPVKKINEISKSVIGDFQPDLTFILDLGVRTGLSRSNKRLAEQHGYQSTEDRFERMDIEFHERVRKGFSEIAGSDPARCVLINAERDIESVQNEILEISLSRIKTHGTV